MEVTNFYNYGTMNEVEAGATQINNYYGAQPQDSGETTMPTPEQLARAVLKTQAMFWGKSSYAVLFCVLRDCYGYPDNASQFEREMNELPLSRPLDYVCPEGTVSSTLHNNEYMRLPIVRWRENGARERVMKLAEALKTALSEGLEE